MRSSTTYTTAHPAPDATPRGVEQLTISEVRRAYREGRRDFQGCAITHDPYPEQNPFATPVPAATDGAAEAAAEEPLPTDLSNADFERSTFNYVDFTRYTLANCRFVEALLGNARFSETDLTAAHFYGARGRNATFAAANLTGASFNEADLTGANFGEAICTRASFQRANLSGAYFHRTQLDRADFSEAQLFGVDFSGARGLLDPVTFLEQLERDHLGYLVYKTFGAHHSPPERWILEPGQLITEAVQPDLTVTCGCGINVASYAWVRQEYIHDSDELEVWRGRIRFEWLAGVVVPWGTDGKFRTSRLELLQSRTGAQLYQAERAGEPLWDAADDVSCATIPPLPRP